MGCELSDNAVVMYLLVLWPSELAATLHGAKVDSLRVWSYARASRWT